MSPLDKTHHHLNAKWLQQVPAELKRKAAGGGGKEIYWMWLRRFLDLNIFVDLLVY